MQDSIYHMALNCYFICNFAVRCNFSTIKKCGVNEVTVLCYCHSNLHTCILNLLMDYRNLMHDFITLSDS